MTLFIDGTQVARTKVERQIPLRTGTECFDVGLDSRSPVCPDYEDRGQFPFTGTIDSVTFDFGDFDEPTDGPAQARDQDGLTSGSHPGLYGDRL